MMQGTLYGCAIAAIASAIAMVRLAISACNRSTIRPSSWIAPREAFSGRSKAAMILRASATSSAGGVKIALQASIWLGMDQRLAVKAEIAALRAFDGKAVDIADIAVGTVEDFEAMRARRQNAMRDHRDHRGAARLHPDPRLPRNVVRPEHEAREPCLRNPSTPRPVCPRPAPRARSRSSPRPGSRSRR